MYLGGVGAEEEVLSWEDEGIWDSNGWLSSVHGKQNDRMLSGMQAALCLARTRVGYQCNNAGKIEREMLQKR